MDGHEDDWVDIPPQYYDEESRVSIRAMNNGQPLTLGLDGNEGEAFSLVIKPRNAHNNLGEQSREQANMPPQNKPQGFVDITYPNPTGPETMSSAEAGGKGIDAFMKKNKYGQVVFEANLTLDAIALLKDIKPETR